MIVIPDELLAAVVAHACGEAPQEVCGWLAGKENEVRRVYPGPNAAKDPRIEFVMDPGMQLSAMREIRDSGLELTGTYHSHPRTPAIPSPRDRSLALYPDAAHLIVSLARGAADSRCYHITGSGIFEVALRVSRTGPNMRSTWAGRSGIASGLPAAGFNHHRTTASEIGFFEVDASDATEEVS